LDVVQLLLQVCAIAYTSSITFLKLYVPDWFALRQLLKTADPHAAENIKQHLFFYDCSIGFLSSLFGLLYVYVFFVLNSCYKQLHKDPIVSFIAAKVFGVTGSWWGTEHNHALNMFYSKPFEDPEDKRASKPTKWFFKSLRTIPFWKNEDIQNSDEVKQVCDELTKNWKEILQEFENSAKAKKLENHPDMQTEVNKEKGGQWDWRFFHGVGGPNQEVMEQCPLTAKLLDTFPVNKPFGFVFFSQLKPGTQIYPHTGSTNLRLRVHLGLQVPSEQDGRFAHIKVAEENHPWLEHGCIAFDDSYIHSVEYKAANNKGDTLRTVLIVDLWQPDITKEERAILSDPLFLRFGKVNFKTTSLKKFD
jgi:hypothetical protein